MKVNIAKSAKKRCCVIELMEEGFAAEAYEASFASQLLILNDECIAS